MTRKEVQERYQIPEDILQLYEKGHLCRCKCKAKEAYVYKDTNIENLENILTLYHSGFSPEEIKLYMQLLSEKELTAEQRLKILKRKRKETLERIHAQEKQLENIDYLRYEIDQTTKNK